MTNNEPFDPQRKANAARVMAEYLDQPALCLTIEQAARLCQLDPTSASAALDELARSGYLRRVGTRFYFNASEVMACGC
jgi:hypothetical protein